MAPKSERVRHDPDGVAPGGGCIALLSIIVIAILAVTVVVVAAVTIRGL
jgi:hypothetical protein